MRIIITLTVVWLTLLSMLGCRRTDAVFTTTNDSRSPIHLDFSTGKTIRVEGDPFGINSLLPEEQVTPMRYDKARILGAISEEDKAKLATLVARLPTVAGFRQIDSMQVFWPDRTVAAKISVRVMRVYCVKNKHGVWDIVAVDTHVQ